MARGGLRVGEALAASRGDIDPLSGTLSIVRSLTRAGDVVPVKGRKRTDQGRTIPMSQDLADRLRQHNLATPPSFDGMLFKSRQGGPIRYGNGRRRIWYRIITESSIDAVPHDLRHTAATRLFTVDG